LNRRGASLSDHGVRHRLQLRKRQTAGSIERTVSRQGVFHLRGCRWRRARVASCCRRARFSKKRLRRDFTQRLRATKSILSRFWHKWVIFMENTKQESGGSGFGGPDPGAQVSDVCSMGWRFRFWDLGYNERCPFSAPSGVCCFRMASKNAERLALPRLKKRRFLDSA